MKSPRHLLHAALFLLIAACPTLLAQEHLELGKMWTFDHPPLEYFKATYGFEPSQSWLDATRLASLRLESGCSASFVSPRGLILSNHHCVREAVAQASQPNEHLLRDGFVAHSLQEERPLKGFTATQLVAMQDVTKQMNAGVQDADDDGTVTSKRNQNRDAILKAAKAKHPQEKLQVVNLYQGALFKLYRYKIYNDLRLCMVPNLQTAYFGGDPDNFTYPRYDIDFSLVRAYENGKPVDSSSFYFKFNAQGPSKGELVFVTGNPGTTKRLNTLAEMELARDVELPIRLAHIEKNLELLRGIQRSQPALKERLEPQILNYENAQKAFKGYLGGVQDKHLMAQKAAAEKSFQAKVQANPEASRRFGDAWSRLDEICAELRKLLPETNFYNGAYTPLLQRAVALVDACNQALPEKQRTSARKLAVRPPRPWRPLTLQWNTFRLNLARQWLPKEDPFMQVVASLGNTQDALNALATGSNLSDDGVVKALLKAGSKGIQASNDPALKVARVLAPLIHKAGARVEALQRERQVQATRIGQALFAVYGTQVAPDATFTLRLSDGVVKGFPMNGTIAPPWTVFYGLYARNAEFGNNPPFDLPQRWLDRKDKINLTRPLDFVSTNDIIGGNSGSPVINTKREVVGLIFDGNIQMLPNRYVYSDQVARAVSVHTGAIMEALEKIYDAQPLADELKGQDGYH